MASDIGLIGLGTMGSALARNLASRGWHVSVYNRHEEKTQAFLDAHQGENLSGFKKLEGFVISLTKPRKVLLMVEAGAPVDAVIAGLLPLLEPGDIVIDGGNSYFRDTIRREEELAGKGIRFVGLGVSGGEEGALRGPSMMAGGEEGAYEAVRPLLERAAAKDFNGQACLGYMGGSGAGHAVKMVHNGIEYAIMQAMNDVYHFLRHTCGMEPGKIADVFDGWRKEGLDGYLMEIAVEIMRKNDDLADGPLIERISDVSHQKGTGKWTSIEALEHGVPLSTINAGVETRLHSKDQEARKALSGHKVVPTKFKGDLPDHLFRSLRASILVSFAQGMKLLDALSATEEFQINVPEALRVWQGGCIIRMELLKELAAAYQESDERSAMGSQGSVDGASSPLRGEGGVRGAPSLLQTKMYADACRVEDFGPAMEVLAAARVPHPAIAASYQWLLSSVSDPLPTTLIQGMRDYFGAHTYLRTDREGIFRTDWRTPSSRA